MYVLEVVTCKNEEDPIKNDGARVVRALSINLRCSRAANSLTGFKDLAEIQTHTSFYG